MTKLTLAQRIRKAKEDMDAEQFGHLWLARHSALQGLIFRNLDAVLDALDLADEKACK